MDRNNEYAKGKFLKMKTLQILNLKEQNVCISLMYIWIKEAQQKIYRPLKLFSKSIFTRCLSYIQYVVWHMFKCLSDAKNLENNSYFQIFYAADAHTLSEILLNVNICTRWKILLQHIIMFFSVLNLLQLGKMTKFLTYTKIILQFLSIKFHF